MRHNWHRGAVGFGLALAALAALAFPRPAAAQTAPTLANNQASAFRNIVQTGDILILVRYELPVSISDGVSDAWCAYLDDQTGCDGSPAVPEAPDTMLPQTVSVTFWSDCVLTNCTAATQLEYADQLPRIDHALAGIYFPAGHNLTWADANYAACIESNAVTFLTANEQDCINPTWSAAASDQATQRGELGDELVGMLRTIETDRSDPPLSIVNGSNLITDNGRVFAIEAFGVIARIVPEVFQAAANPVATPYATPSSGSALQSSLDSDNAAFVTDWETIGQWYFGSPGRNVTFVISILIAFVAAGTVGAILETYTASKLSGELAAGAATFTTVLAIGMAASAVPVDGFFAWTFFMAWPMAWWIVAKARS